MELEDAKKAAKKLSKKLQNMDFSTVNEDDINTQRIQTQLRIATAYNKLRQFKALKTAVAICRSMNPTDEIDIKTLEKYQAEADEALDPKFAVYMNQIDKQAVDDLMSGKADINHFVRPHDNVQNTNLLQCSALKGDVYTMERAAAYGASLDYPLMDAQECRKVVGVRMKETVPPDNTALTLTAANLVHVSMFMAQVHAFQGMMPDNLNQKINNLYLEVLKPLEDCVVQLIMLGADFYRKLRLPARPPPSGNRGGRSNQRDSLFTNDKNCIVNWFKYNLNGMTVEQMVNICKSQRALDAIEAMRSWDDQVANAHCRCGSRLKWKECHACGFGEERFCVYDNERRALLWRVSPLARCQCKESNKAGYDCCWKAGRRMYYMNDATGVGTFVSSSFIMPNEMLEDMSNLNISRSPNGAEEFHNALKQGKCPQAILNLMQKDWPKFCSFLPQETHGKSGLQNMDPKVYAGCISRIHDFFYWNNAHWATEENDLLVRVSEWNTALELYCNDHNLIEEARRTVYERHKASPFAPCGNRRCEEKEKKIKGFNLCGGCKKISYCTKLCQKTDWKRHKAECRSSEGVMSVNAM